jgi:hypothetical protein
MGVRADHCDYEVEGPVNRCAHVEEVDVEAGAG